MHPATKVLCTNTCVPPGYVNVHVISSIHDSNWFMSSLLPPANEIYEGYVFTPVCQSFCSQGGLHLGVCASMGRSKSGGLYPVLVCGGGQVGRLPPNRILWDTVNERAVHILLERILVLYVKITKCNWSFNLTWFFLSSLKTKSNN